MAVPDHAPGVGSEKIRAEAEVHIAVPQQNVKDGFGVGGPYPRQGCVRNQLVMMYLVPDRTGMPWCSVA